MSSDKNFHYYRTIGYICSIALVIIVDSYFWIKFISNDEFNWKSIKFGFSWYIKKRIEEIDKFIQFLFYLKKQLYRAYQ